MLSHRHITQRYKMGKVFVIFFFFSFSRMRCLTVWRNIKKSFLKVVSKKAFSFFAQKSEKHQTAAKEEGKS